MQILELLGMYFDAVVVEVKKNLLLFRLALAILWWGTCISYMRSEFLSTWTYYLTWDNFFTSERCILCDTVIILLLIYLSTLKSLFLSYPYVISYFEERNSNVLIWGHSITTWTRWGVRGSKNVCFCPRSGYKNCPRRGGQKMAKFCPRSCWMTPFGKNNQWIINNTIVTHCFSIDFHWISGESNWDYERRMRTFRRRLREADWTWLTACMGVVEADMNPVEAYLNTGGDPTRKLTNPEVAMLNRPSVYEAGHTLVHLAIK